MKNIFFVFLIPIIGLTISSCANSKEDTSGALTQMDQVLDQPNSTDDENNPDFPTVTISSCYLLNNSTIDNIHKLPHLQLTTPRLFVQKLTTQLSLIPGLTTPQ